jgi:hypothetical protein
MSLMRPRSRKKRSLPRGWAYPITPTQVRELLPRVASVYWVDLHTLSGDYRPEHWMKVPHFSLQWDPTSPRLQPRLSVRAVPTKSQTDVRAWFQDSVVPEARAWLTSLDRTSAVPQEKAWWWPLEANSSVGSTPS